MHIAAREGHIELVKLFVAKEVNVNLRDEHGYSASYWAHQFKHFDIAQLLPAPLKITKEEFYQHILISQSQHGLNKKKKGKKGKKGGKKKK